MNGIPFPDISPVIVEIGPFALRWYALAYIVGILAGWRYAIHLAGRLPGGPSRTDLDDFIVWATLGIILGGRIGWVIFYGWPLFGGDWLRALYIWEGGMSFHGGLIGTAAAIVLFAWRRGLDMLRFADIISAVVPIGLGLGRLANFVNAELYGRVTDLPWGVIFPGQVLARHPSQLYEAVLEGLILFGVLALLARGRVAAGRPGLMTATFVCLYALARFAVEFVREPDPQLGFLGLGLTMGQWLSAAMLLAGLLILARACRRRRPVAS